MRKPSEINIKSIMESDTKRLTSFDLFGKTRTPFNHVRHPAKEYFPTSRAGIKQHTQHQSSQNTQPYIKSPANSKPMSLANAISLLSEQNPTSRRNSRRLHTHQLKSMLGKEVEKVSLESVRFNTQFQNQQPIIQFQRTSPKKSLKTSPDTKNALMMETFRNRISHKLSGHMQDQTSLKQKLRGSIQKKQYKYNNFTNMNYVSNNNSFQEDIEFKFNKQIKLPQTPQIVLQYYSNQLTDYEKGEILDVDIVYYLRPETVDMPQTDDNNFGFDTETNDYKFREHDHIIYRYEMLEQMGHGSFGFVFKVYDHKHKQEAAIKIIKNKDKFKKQALIEIEILKTINKADNSCCLIKMLNYFTFRNHVCMVFELLSCNLYEFLAINEFQGFELDLVRRFAIQILQGLLYLQECNIIHCDLKPENILLKDISRSGIKIIDFGSSCFANCKLYTYIQSRFYRAPEIVLGIPYTNQIDMWSFGCIVAELHLGQSLFQSKSEKELLFLQSKILGKPQNHFIDLCPKRNKFFNTNYELLTKLKDSELLFQLKPLKELLQNSSDQFYDFVNKCLQWDPILRMRPAEALIHPWILEGLPLEIKKQHLNQMKQYISNKNEQGQGVQIK